MPRLIARLLLAVCLVLNGLGSVTLATTMQVQMAAPALALSSPAGEGDSHCRGHGAMQDGTDATDQQAQMADGGDCCQPDSCNDASRCDGACAQHAIVIPLRLATASSEDLADRYRAPSLPGHDDPLLRRAVRPPIA